MPSKSLSSPVIRMTSGQSPDWGTDRIVQRDGAAAGAISLVDNCYHQLIEGSDGPNWRK